MKGFFTQVKTNLVFVLLALCFLAWLGRDIYHLIVEVVQSLNAAETRADFLEATNALLLHLLAGTLILPFITVVGGMGIRLLDEKPEQHPTVPADTHDKAVDQLAAALNHRMDKTADALKRMEDTK